MGIKKISSSLSFLALLAQQVLLLVLLLAPCVSARVPEIIQERTGRRPDSGGWEVGGAKPKYDKLHPKLVQWLEPYVDDITPTPPKLLGYDVSADGSLQPKLLTIGMFSKKMKFHRDLPPSTVYAYGTDKDSATFPGPLIEAIQGVPTYVRWENHLPPGHILPVDPNISIARTTDGGIPTVVHLHGGIVPPESDGNIEAWFTANFSQRGPAWTTPTYTYPNVQHPGNLIYHDHARGITRLNLLAGLVGPYVIRNPAVEYDQLNLPRGDDFDRVLLVADKKFKEDGSIFMDLVPQSKFHTLWRPGYFGQMMTVNGKIWPYMRVQRRKYRFRIINASNSRYMEFVLTNQKQNLSFTAIGSDATFLAAPVTTYNVVLSNAEIGDVIVDFSKVKGDSILMKNVRGYFPDTPLTPPQQLVMKFLIDDESAPAPNDDTSSIPPALVPYAGYDMSEVSTTRYISYYELDDADQEALQFKINGLGLDDPATEKPRVGSTELWNVINTVNDEHPIHVHLGLMQPIRSYKLFDTDRFVRCMNHTYDVDSCALSRHYNPAEYTPVAEYDRTWKNVVRIPPVSMISVVVKFNLVETNTSYPFDATAFPGYLYHCHVLGHEDNEMIRPLKLIP